MLDGGKRKAGCIFYAFEISSPRTGEKCLIENCIHEFDPE